MKRIFWQARTSRENWPGEKIRARLLVLVGCNRNNSSYSCTPRYGRLPYKMRQSLEGRKRSEGRVGSDESRDADSAHIPSNLHTYNGSRVPREQYVQLRTLNFFFVLVLSNCTKILMLLLILFVFVSILSYSIILLDISNNEILSRLHYTFRFSFIFSCIIFINCSYYICYY